MTSHERSIDVARPARVVYNQWMQFETVPRFMDGVESVVQVDLLHMHWVTKVEGTTREFDTEIVELIPDQRVAWKSTSGPEHAGIATFHGLGNDATRVILKMDFGPEGVVENPADSVDVVGLRLQGDLERFKEFMESETMENGA